MERDYRKISKEKEMKTKTDEKWLKEVWEPTRKHLSKVRNSEEYKTKHYEHCIYCNIFTSKMNIKKWHNERCKKNVHTNSN